MTTISVLVLLVDKAILLIKPMAAFGFVRCANGFQQGSQRFQFSRGQVAELPRVARPQRFCDAIDKSLPRVCDGDEHRPPVSRGPRAGEQAALFELVEHPGDVRAHVRRAARPV